MKKVYVSLVAVALAVLFGAVSFMNYSNGEIQIRKQVEAQQEKLHVVFDATWKIIQQKAEVADQYKDAFSKIYPALMAGRYGNARGGALLSFVTESNPNFDVTLYKDLSNAIEGQRMNFANEQSRLVDMKREHDTLCEMFPGNMFLKSRDNIQIDIVTSAKTEDTFKSGQDNDVSLFSKK
jgi:hypothetical protein